jgi:hypothetical protein
LIHAELDKTAGDRLWIAIDQEPVAVVFDQLAHAAYGCREQRQATRGSLEGDQ